MLPFRLSSLYTLMVFICIFAAGAYYTHLNTATDRKEYLLLMEEVVSVQAAAIERRLTRSLSSTYILAQEVRRSNGQFKDFDKFAEEVMQTLGGVSNLQLAPDGITQNTYPLEGNEKGIGHNLLRSDARKQEAWQAIRTKTLTLAGPFMLVQGRIGMVGRNPVFLEQNGESSFWGFATALIYLDDLLAFTELDQLQQKGYAFELSRVHPDTGQVDVFARSHSELDEPRVTRSIKVPNGEWTITMSRPTDFTFQIMIGLALSLITAVMFALLIRRILREPERLRELVKQQTAQLELLAFNDELTGLANRRFLTSQLEQAILRSQRDGECLALMYLDLDDFKRVNDAMGHEDGDRLLIEVSRRLKNGVRQADIVGRLGGDEFAIILLDIKSAENTRRIAENLIASINVPVQLGQHDAVVGASIGITLAPEDGASSGELLRNADLAMYGSKRAGKNQLSFYNPIMQEQVLDSIRLEKALRLAIEQQQFFLVFQPIVALAHGRVEKFEALLRWDQPERGIQKPASFIGVAELTGLIVPIGYWVLEAACHFIRRQMGTGRPPRPVAINLSVCQLRDADFADRVTALLTRFQIPSELLELEITESMLMENVNLAMSLLERLRDLGIHISIDDFGTGYSSLSQLRRLPVHSLKIDRSFVMDLETSRIDQQMVAGITAMVHKLNLKVVAEGIETRQQMRLLREIGCDHGQGILFAEPLALEQALEYIGHAELLVPPLSPPNEACDMATVSQY